MSIKQTIRLYVCAVLLLLSAHIPALATGMEPWLVSLIIGVSLSAASAGINYLLRPKPKPAPKQKGSDLQLTDSAWGVAIPRVHGHRGSDNIGGVQVGANIIWASEIRKEERQVQGQAGQSRGGKGGAKKTDQKETHFLVDFAGLLAEGRQRLLRLRLNEDVVYTNFSPLTSEPAGTKYEAEAGTRTGTAAIINESGFSSGQGVNALNSTGTLTLSLTGIGSKPVALHVSYKSTAEATCEVEMNGETWAYTFPASSVRAFRTIYKVVPTGTQTIKFKNASASGLKLDAVIVETSQIDYAAPSDLPYLPSGVIDDAMGGAPLRDNYLLVDPVSDFRSYENINRANLPGAEAADGSILTTLSNGAELAFYPGDETQTADSVISAWVTSQGYPAGYCQAFRGSAYFRLKNLDITKWRSFPAVFAVIENMDTGTVAEILLSEALRCGMDEADLDFTAAEAYDCRGYLISGEDAASKVFNELGLTHNLGFAERSDGKLYAIDHSTRTAVATLTSDDLAAFSLEQGEGSDSETPSDEVVTTMTDERDLPRTLALQFINPVEPVNYNTDKRDHVFPFTSSVRVDTMTVNETLTPDEAEKTVSRINQDRWLHKDPASFKTKQDFAWIDPGDCVNIELETRLHLYRVKQKQGTAPGVFEFSAVPDELYINADGSTTNLVMRPETPGIPAASVGTLMELPRLYDEQFAGIYAACSPVNGGNWPGAVLYRQKGNDWQQIATFTKSCLMGRAVNALADAPGGYAAGDIETTNTVTVDFLNNFQPDTVTADILHDGGNLYLVGRELVSVQTWTRNNSYPNRWNGTNLIRRGRATPDTNHVVAERVVFFTDAVQYVALEPEELGIERAYRFVTSGETVDQVPSQLFTWLGGANTEIAAPVLSQLEAATNTAVLLGFGSFSAETKFLRLEFADNSGFTGSDEIEFDRDQLNGTLPASYLFTKASEASAVHRWFRLYASSNGVDYSPASVALDVTFADSGGSGGSSGGSPPTMGQVTWDGINEEATVNWVDNGGTGQHTVEYRQREFIEEPLHRWTHWTAWAVLSTTVGAGATSYVMSHTPSGAFTELQFRVKKNDIDGYSLLGSVYVG